MSNDNNDVGVFTKQESVMSLYYPAQMSPTSTKSFASSIVPDVAQKNDSARMKRNISYGNLAAQSEARVLVLYTGKKNRKISEFLNNLKCHQQVARLACFETIKMVTQLLLKSL